MSRALKPRARLTGLVRAPALKLVPLICGCLLVVGPSGLSLGVSSAQAAETVTLHASFTPDRLGTSTTIGFGFTIANTSGGLPSPLTSVKLRMPENMNYITSSLGLATCQPVELVEKGLSGCPPNSRLGYGSAFVEVPFGQSAGREIPDIQALMGPPHDGNVVVLFYANGLAPVYAQIVFQGELLSGGRGFGESLNAGIPLIPSVTNGPPVSIINVNSTIGPNHLTYYKRVHGKLVGYQPQGVDVPETCPPGGFPFSGEFGFLDGSVVVANSNVPCPPPVHHKKKK
jgi:hypothetical protein